MQKIFKVFDVALGRQVLIESVLGDSIKKYPPFKIRMVVSMGDFTIERFRIFDNEKERNYAFEMTDLKSAIKFYYSCLHTIS